MELEVDLTDGILAACEIIHSRSDRLRRCATTFVCCNARKVACGRQLELRTHSVSVTIH